jgi:signal transduction histidine kinase
MQAFLRRHLLKGSMRSRILFIALIPSLVTACLLTVYFVQTQTAAAERAAREQLLNAARTLAAASQYAISSGNHTLLAQVVARERAAAQLDYAQACDRNQVVLARCGALPGGVPALPTKAGDVESHGGVWFTSHPILLPDSALGAGAPDFSDPQDASRAIVGHITVGLSPTPILAARRQAILSAAGLMLAAVLLTTLIAWRLSGRLTRQIRQVSQSVDRIAGGELAVRVNEDASAEIGNLEHGINRLAEALAASQRDMQASIAAATASLAAKKEEAERANIAKSRFFAAASHDLRQPLHALTLFVGALKEHARYPELRPLVDHIDASVAAMETLFNSLLDISRLDAGVLEVQREHFPANRLLERVRQQCAELAREKGLRFRVRPCPLALYSDPVLLERILLNLVANAIRYTHDGGVLVACRRRGDNVVLQVYDTGVGIPQGSLDLIFQEFVQLNNPARDRERGLGLGLAIVSRLARLLDQRVQVRSVTGRGSVFSVEVPTGSADLAAQPPAPGTLSPLPLHGSLALLIDDEEAILRAMEELFDAWGIDLVTARNVEEAVDWLHNIGRTPDLLVSDYRLADHTDGIEVIHYLRLCFGNDLPALILTGDTAPETLQRIRDAGLAVLHKPLRPARLRALVMHLMRPQSA